jgi:hypothetical protein
MTRVLYGRVLEVVVGFAGAEWGWSSATIPAAARAAMPTPSETSAIKNFVRTGLTCSGVQ